MATREDIPFDIEAVAKAMGIQVKRQVRDQLYCRCPFCDDHAAHLNINLTKNVFRCPRCGTQGGILDLYAKYHEISKNQAYNELCDLLKGDGQFTAGDCSSSSRRKIELIEEMPLAAPEIRNNTYSNLFALLALGSAHKENLFMRGLSESQIRWTNYRTTPVVRSKKLVTTLLESGCRLDGVPGFYIDKGTGRWELDIRCSGIMLPDRNLNGEIEAVQIRRDHVDHHSKFINLTSTGRYMGVTSACCPHYVGFDQPVKIAYITEGIMKADIAHCLSKELGQPRAFVGLTGVANTNQYKRALTELHETGCSRLVLAFDSDATTNPHVAQALKKAEQIGINMGFEILPLFWDPHYKGIDDLLLSFRED